MIKSPGRRVRVALMSLAAIGLAASAAAPAFADTTTPVAPTKLLNGSGNPQACATDAGAPFYDNPSEELEIEGAPTLSDGSSAPTSIEYQLWPVDDPSQISTWTLSAVTNYDAPLNVPGSDFTDGQTYAWDAATVYNGVTSAYSAPCYVAVDETRPANAPTVTSTNYPENVTDQPGAPVHVTFGANGVSDVVGYVFNWNVGMPIPEFNGPLSDPYVGVAGSEPVSTLGGSATLDLVPSQPSDYMLLQVESVDRAGNLSPVTTYTITTKNDIPTITQQGHLANYGKPTGFALAPDAGIEAQSPVTSYNVMVAGGANGQQNFSVPANADGTAQTQITFDSPTGEFVQVSSVSADGWVSSAQDYSFNPAPKISSDVYAENATSGGVGVKGKFTFQPTVKGVVSYSYSWDYGTTQTVVPAHDGQASVSWTPTASGSYDIEVYAILADGTQLTPYDYFFNVG